MDLLEHIKKALLSAGMEELPTDTSESLVTHGMDSLMMVLGVAALEKELSLRISGKDFSEQAFHSLDTLEAWLRELGAT